MFAVERVCDVLLSFSGEGTVWAYDCDEEDGIKEWGAECKELTKEEARVADASSGVLCFCDSGDECNKFPCTSDNFKAEGWRVRLSWLCLVAVGVIGLSLA